MKVFILCGGYGTRLDHEGKNNPKALIKIGREPIIIHLIKIFLKYKYTEFVLCMGYKQHLIKKFFFQKYKVFIIKKKKDLTLVNLTINKINVKIYFVNTGLHTGTGGRIKIANKIIKNQSDFFMTYCDGLAKINLNSLYNSFKKSNKLVTLTAVRPQHRYGVIKIKKNLVLSFNNNNPKQDIWVNGGFFLIKTKALELIKNKNIFWEQEPLRILINKKELSCYRLNNFWASLDTQKDKINLNTLWKKKKSYW